MMDTTQIEKLSDLLGDWRIDLEFELLPYVPFQN